MKACKRYKCANAYTKCTSAADKRHGNHHNKTGLWFLRKIYFFVIQVVHTDDTQDKRNHKILTTITFLLAVFREQFGLNLSHCLNLLKELTSWGQWSTGGHSVTSSGKKCRSHGTQWQAQSHGCRPCTERIAVMLQCTSWLQRVVISLTFQSAYKQGRW